MIVNMEVIAKGNLLSYHRSVQKEKVGHRGAGWVSCIENSHVGGQKITLPPSSNVVLFKYHLNNQR
jgi:hypothetical protein